MSEQNSEQSANVDEAKGQARFAASGLLEAINEFVAVWSDMGRGDSHMLGALVKDVVSRAYAEGFREAYDVTDPEAPKAVIEQSLEYNWTAWRKRSGV